MVDLRLLYHRYKTRGFGNDELKSKLCCPLLIDPPADWSQADQRICFIGQETRGWYWNIKQAELAKTSWQYADQIGFVDFFNECDSVDALMTGYRLFDFANFNRKAYHGAFWQYFHRLSNLHRNQDETVSFIWTNMIRCAVDGERGFKLSHLSQSHRREYMEWQAGLLSEELKIIHPTTVIFVTGPLYDPYITEEFGSVQFEPLDGFDVRQAARLHSESFKVPAYRTYHPGYLNGVPSLGFSPLQKALEEAYRQMQPD